MIMRVLLFSSFMFLAACGIAPSEKVMPMLEYKQDISVQTHKNADLFWQTGMELGAIEPSQIQSNDPLAALIGSAIDAQLRKSNPSRYTYTYGGAQQAVFISSVKKVLTEQRVFNTVKLISSEKEYNPNDVLIQLRFITTRVSDPTEQYAITLTVEMTIKALGRKTYTRIYSVHNTPNDSIWTGRTFQMQQTEVSERLLKQLLNGITNWYQHI